MTRAYLDLTGENVATVRLYRNHDGYISGGLGEELNEFCKKQKVGVTPSDILFSLLSDGNPYELELLGDNIGVDYIYRITCSSSDKPTLTCWEIDWLGDNKRPLEERMGDPIDIEKEIEEGKEDKWSGLLPCPFCGRNPSIRSSFREGTTIECSDESCRGSRLIGRYQVAHDAELAWNDICKHMN